ncbi:N-acetylmuramoyl-L-alanine amidase [Leptolyngbya sp. PCC 6406]|uniref:N-acetylmuramoyl-L-alanine amidase n=1 Tax=Leptolyngbya sp. PCC 6406 TaxID=1173264 RepID=UPI0002ABA3D5|nr:N-acetylmuramoyl-L-alanine amidase [Leptolyngbya sp. PCC 6406]
MTWQFGLMAGLAVMMGGGTAPALALAPVSPESLVTSSLAMTPVDPAQPSTALFVAYPPPEHTTSADRIFLIGTGIPGQPVQVNGEVIDPRSPAGHFAPSLPLAMGENVFTLTQGEETLTLRVIRVSATPAPPEGLAFAPNSLTPGVDIARQPGEMICFSAIAPPNATVTVTWATETLTLRPRPEAVTLPPNSAALTAQNEPLPLAATPYEGCTVPRETGLLGQPTYTLTQRGQSLSQTAPGAVEILAAVPTQVAEVIVEGGTARTGPSTDYSRLTPLPQGTRAAVTGREGDWLRLDYGAWIRASETQVVTAAPPRTTIRSVRSRQIPGWTEVLFPLQTPVPVTVAQTADTVTLTLHNTTPQTDTIYLEADPVIRRLDWMPLLPDKAQYVFHLQSPQPWGYKLHYEGTTLVLSLRHPPQVRRDRPLVGTTILLDPGHGSDEDLGARGPNGYPEKDVNLILSHLLRSALEAKGATVVMTREGDEDLFPGDRVDIINAVEPTLALSIHYNALPDAGDALNTAGIGAFWYNAQAHDLSVFLHDYLVRELNRPSYGVFWNNLALTRPTAAPSVLLELGFMINPFEFEWIVDPAAQEALAQTLADGVEAWILRTTDP